MAKWLRRVLQGTPPRPAAHPGGLRLDVGDPNGSWKIAGSCRSSLRSSNGNRARPEMLTRGGPMNGVPSPARGEMQESVAELLNRTQYTADEAGTAPGDRKFRADVEGLRAVAIGLVVLYHANLSASERRLRRRRRVLRHLGVRDHGLLLRETTATGRTSFIAFYGRRCRRILPAATLVIVVTVVGDLRGPRCVLREPDRRLTRGGRRSSSRTSISHRSGPTT